MSILIRGMEMPENCILCPLIDGEYGGCLVDGKGHGDPNSPEGCPLVEVPTPHGRLGDLDHIAEFISNMLKHEDGNLKTWSDYEVLDMIESSPTIIEAEGEEENEKID